MDSEQLLLYFGASLLVITLSFLLWHTCRRRFKISPSGRYVLVTGCDSGFGLLLVRRLSEIGFGVFAGCLTEQGVACVKKSCPSQSTIAFIMDVTREDDIRRAVTLVSSHVPSNTGLWGLVNNAAILGAAGPADWLPDCSAYREVLEVNLLGLVNVTYQFLPLLKEAKGRIVNMSSVLGRVANPLSAPYSVTKFAVEAFSDIMRMQLRPFDISVHIIEPGFFDTPMTDISTVTTAVQRTWEQAPDHVRRSYGDRFLKIVCQFVSRDLGMASPVQWFITFFNRNQLVVNAQVDAVFSRHPKSRYIVGVDASCFFIPHSWMPSFVGDLMLRLVTPQFRRRKPSHK